MKKNDAPGVKTPLFDRIFKPEIITLENGHTVARPRSRTPLIALLVIAALAISIKVTGFNLSIIFRRANQLTKILSQIFQPDPSFFSKVVTPLLDTIKMSIMGSVIGCLLAGVFEEVGRYLAFRFLLKRYTNRWDAVTYGIGHGGIEAILVLGLTAINNIAIAQLVNSGSIETITNGLTGVQLDQVQAQIAAVASFGAANLLLGLAERAIAMTLHISLSVVVFRAVRQRKAGYLGLAVVLHALFDVPAALFQCGVLHSTWLVEALLLVLCLGCAAYAKKQYCALQEPEQQMLSDKEES